MIRRAGGDEVDVWGRGGVTVKVVDESFQFVEGVRKRHEAVGSCPVLCHCALDEGGPGGGGTVDVGDGCEGARGCTGEEKGAYQMEVYDGAGDVCVRGVGCVPVGQEEIDPGVDIEGAAAGEGDLRGRQEEGGGAVG